MPLEKTRCPWAKTPALISYHDGEWGKPIRDDRALFELLVLEGMQAGLAWETILVRRERYREAFANFEVEHVAAFTESDVERLVNDAGIIRNRRKIVAAIANARAAVHLRREFGSLSNYFWKFVDGKPLVRHPSSVGALLASTPAAAAMAEDLRKRGFGFVGPKMAYAFMQAAGLARDHFEECYLAKT